MKVAVAGTGDVAQYLFEELRRYGHELVVLTRSAKPGRDYEQRPTDYSVSSLVEVLKDVDALVSTIADYSNPPAATKIHIDMLEACKQSRKCKTFIPSEWTCDVETYPEQPVFLAEHNRTLHEKLKEVKDLRWTIICNSWFADYVVPSSQRHLRDIGELWQMDHANKVFTIYGPGTQTFDMVSVRDVATAVAALIDSKEPWEPFTFLSGDQLSPNELFAIIQRRDPAWKSQNKPLATTVKHIVDNKSPEEVTLGYFELLLYSGASKLPQEKVQMQRTKYFPRIHFRSVEELLDIATIHSGGAI